MRPQPLEWGIGRDVRRRPRGHVAVTHDSGIFRPVVARRPEEEHVLVLRNEAARCQFEDERAIELFVKREIKRVERALGIAEAGLLAPALEETDDGIWAIHFNTVLLATFDERDSIITG